MRQLFVLMLTLARPLLWFFKHFGWVIDAVLWVGRTLRRGHRLWHRVFHGAPKPHREWIMPASDCGHHYEYYVICQCGCMWRIDEEAYNKARGPEWKGGRGRGHR